MATDYYAALGVDRTASGEEIKRAYRRLARELHPDARPNDAASEARFKEVAQAYEVLSDPDRRRQYDMFGAEGMAGAGAGSPFGFGGGLGDIFEAFFAGSGASGFGGRGPTSRPRGADLEVRVELDFEEAVFGVTKDVTVRLPVTCDACTGTGARPGTAPVTCPECQGSGQVRRVRQSILGQMVTAGPCPRCGGAGQAIADPCPDCRGDGRRTEERTYTVEVPAGVDDGATLRLGGRGAAGSRGGGAGDLYVHLRVRPSDRFVRDGHDLVAEIHVSMTQAALGAIVDLETLEGTEELTIPAGTQTGQVFRLRGRGVPHVNGRGRGDVLVPVTVDTPTRVSRTEEELLRRLAEERHEAVAPPETGLLSRIRGAFGGG